MSARHAARAVARARPARRAPAPRPGRAAAVPADPAAAARHRARVPPHEPVRRAGRLPARVRPHRRPDAARPVPRLHRRPAHPDGAAQPAPLHDARVRARVSALQPADERLRAPLAAVRRRAVPRHRQGPRRRPLRARHRRRAALLPPPRPVARGHRPGRVPGRAPPDHVVGGAEAGRATIPRSCAPSPSSVGRRAAPGRALPADRRRHPRHQPEGLERAGRPSCWRTCSARRAASSPAKPPALDTALAEKQAEATRLLRLYALSDAVKERFWAQPRHHLLPAPRRAGDRLADAQPALPGRHRQAGGARRASRRSAKACR